MQCRHVRRHSARPFAISSKRPTKWRQLPGGRDLCRNSAASAWRSAAQVAPDGRQACPWRPLATLERRASPAAHQSRAAEGQRTKNQFGKKMMEREWERATCAHRRGRWSVEIIRIYIGAFEHGSSRASGPTSKAARGRMAGRAGELGVSVRSFSCDLSFHPEGPRYGKAQLSSLRKVLPG